jgi:hypothetical protein
MEPSLRLRSHWFMSWLMTTRQIIGHHIFIAMCCLNSDFIQCYPLFGIGLPIIGIQIVELEVFWSDDNMKPVSE